MFPKIMRHIGLVAKNNLPMVCSIRHAAAYEGDGKTTVRVINREQELGLMIDAYATYGFRLNNGITVLGPMAIFPRTVLSWQVFDSDEITEESLRLFKLLEPKMDLLIVSAGGCGRRAGEAALRAARALRLNVELLPAEHACATFNFLNAEGRAVAAALIPPRVLDMNEDDAVHSRMHYDDVFHKTLR